MAQLAAESRGGLAAGGNRAAAQPQDKMTRLIKVDLIVWIIIHAFGGSSVTSKIQVYLV
eukprot:COSAG01_NODE_73681_length_239_cov_3.800000_1_plen_58_part_01